MRLCIPIPFLSPLAASKHPKMVIYKIYSGFWAATAPKRMSPMAYPAIMYRIASAPLRTVRDLARALMLRHFRDDFSTAGQKGVTFSVQSARRTSWGNNNGVGWLMCPSSGH
jgi:hypothetical protein